MIPHAMIPNAMLAAFTPLARVLQDASSSDDASLTTESALRWLGAPPAWVTGLVFVPLIAGLVWWTYSRQSQLSTGRKLTLTALRTLAAVLILLAIYRPALEISRNLKLRTEVHILVDDSASMARQESYEDEAASELASALEGRAPERLSTLRRIDLVSRIFGGGGDGASERAVGPGKELLTSLEQDHDLRWYRFFERSDAITSLEDLSAKGSSTRIGDSLDLHLANHGIDSSKLEAVVLVTDGRNNEGLDPIEGAKRLQTSEIPLHVVGVGDAAGERNLVLSGPPGPQQILQNEEAEFELQVRASGLDASAFQLVCKARKQSIEETSSNSDDGFVIASADAVVMPGPGETRKVVLRHSFDEPGDYLLTFSVPPLDGESNPRDNVTRRYLRVDSDKIRVLYVEDKPRWEYRYIEKALARVDKSIVYQCVLLDASRSFRQESSEGLPALDSLPRTKKELFEYHVILLGDIPPERFGTTEEERADYLNLLKEFVEHGGGLGVIAGERAMPDAYRESPLEDLLPVVLGDATDDDVPVATNEEFRPALESPGAPDPIVRFLDDPAQNERLWREGFEGMAWYFPVLRSKAGARVLLRHPRDENKYGRRILVATAPYPKGKVLFSAVDETWRWRKFYGVKYQDRYWRNVVRHLAENKLRRLDDRVVLQVDREQLELGDRVRLDLQLLDDDYNPVLDENARVHVRAPGGELQNIVLPRVQGQAGHFEGALSLEEAGVWSVLYYRDGEAGGRPLARRDLVCSIPKKELDQTSLDEDGLRELAKTGQGEYARLANVDALLRGFRGRGAGMKIVDRKLREVWDQAWTLLLVLLLLSLEWILRKRWRLV